MVRTLSRRMVIEVFKTSVKTEREAFTIIGRIGELLPGARITFDLSDCDHVLRVESTRVPVGLITTYLQHMGYHCTLLE